MRLKSKKKKKKTKFELIYRTVEFFANYAPANRKLYGEIIFYNFVKKMGFVGICCTFLHNLGDSSIKLSDIW